MKSKRNTLTHSTLVRLVLALIVAAMLLPVNHASAQVFRLEPKKAKAAVWHAANRKYSKRKLDKIRDAFTTRLYATQVLRDNDGTLNEGKYAVWQTAINEWDTKLGCSMRDHTAPCKFRGVKTADQVIHSFFDIASRYLGIRSEVAGTSAN